ncbi:hypothetical protein ACFOLL_00665 [Falsochrobactrum ovis]|uniref:Uncharacterized protein n=1 Tax=Falsochrobactrum ovis TaxID=1293442 RepID=A0A364JUF4_9HYPH|nr:hypothetical protein [Falsochrobactrum ovis]RAK28106.1 hypothetical protein C7374_1075 [Falsochrobactrum ovis]
MAEVFHSAVHTRKKRVSPFKSGKDGCNNAGLRFWLAVIRWRSAVPN